MTDSDKLKPEDFLFAMSDTPRSNLVLDSLNLDDIEREVIRKAIDKHSGNISQAAKELGLTRTSLYRRLQKYGL